MALLRVTTVNQTSTLSLLNLACQPCIGHYHISIPCHIHVPCWMGLVKERGHLLSFLSTARNINLIKMHAYLARAVFNRRAVSSSLKARSYATEASATPKTLLFLEHREGKLNPGSLNALSAANTLGGEVIALITGEEGAAGKAAEASKKWVISVQLHHHRQEHRAELPACNNHHLLFRRH